VKGAYFSPPVLLAEQRGHKHIDRNSILFSVLLFIILTVSGTEYVKAAPFAYITNGGDNTVSVIDTSTSTLVATVHGFTGPSGVAVNSAGTRVYISNQGTTKSQLLILRLIQSWAPWVGCVAPMASR
jgi:YVTN family beta-propeller protein